MSEYVPNPTVKVLGQVSDESVRARYLDQVRAAESDATESAFRMRHGRAPTDLELEAVGRALDRRIAAIREDAQAHGWSIPEDPRTNHQFDYDGWWQSNVGQPAGPEGLPAAIHAGQVELWKNAPEDDDRSPAYSAPDKAQLAAVETWLRSAAAPARATELLGLGKRNSVVLSALYGFARAANMYQANRPK